jgi:uncharacterized membrane protein SirB2
MKRFLAAVALLDTVTFLAGLLYVVIAGELPRTVYDAWQAAQTAVLIILLILAVPAIIFFALIIQSQLEPPFGERER